jgi:hypothetical protein
MQDKLRAALLAYGYKEIYLSIDDLIGKTGLTYSQIYQTLYRLQKMGELDILREQDENGRYKVSGVKLNKSEPSEVITERIQDREITKQTSRDLNKVAISVPHTLEYINRKLAVERAREEVVKAHIDPDDVITFTPDPMGEEAVFLFSKLQEAIEINRSLNFDLEAEKRNVAYLKQSTRTFDDSGT